MGTCLDRGIKVVSNAGGLDPAGCAEAVQEVADRLGLSPTIAYVDGDDLLPRIDELAERRRAPAVRRRRRPRRRRRVTSPPTPTSAAWGIVEALDRAAPTS